MDKLSLDNLKIIFNFINTTELQIHEYMTLNEIIELIYKVQIIKKNNDLKKILNFNNKLNYSSCDFISNIIYENFTNSTNSMNSINNENNYYKYSYYD